MKYDSFVTGLEVEYKHFKGIIRFVCSQYITVCIQQFDHKVRDVCLLVYPSEWKDIRIHEK
jgi:hypothetical protein